MFTAYLDVWLALPWAIPLLSNMTKENHRTGRASNRGSLKFTITGTQPIDQSKQSHIGRTSRRAFRLYVY